MREMPEMLDHRRVNWGDVRRTRYVVQQAFHYRYPGPIYDLEQSLIVVPADMHGGQRLLAHEVAVSPPPASTQVAFDRFGNRCFQVGVPHVDRTVSFEVWIEVQRELDNPIRCGAAELAVYAQPTPLTETDAALQAVAAELRATGHTGLALAESIMHWVYGAMQYSAHATSIRTTAAQAFALGRGVCQDYAHIMLAICRSCGVPARYVSGHLLGEGGTHAWVEVLVEDGTKPGSALAIAYDPTHDRPAGLAYITVAVGRDYRDVAPTSGTFRGTYTGELTAHKRAGVVAIEPRTVVA